MIPRKYIYFLQSLLLFICHCNSESCTNPIYCTGPVLEAVQMSRIFQDEKSFVDMTMSKSADEILENFHNLNDNYTKDELEQFVKENFVDMQELDQWYPEDFNENPSFLDGVQNESLKNFSKILTGLWPTLARKVSGTVSKNPNLHSLIPVPNGFIIPGGRFKELYYWDTYWIIKGLLITEMHQTVKGMLENLIYLVTKYGYIPNGSRIYYLNRSQLPLLSSMVNLYVKCADDIDWLNEHIDVLEQELQWFLQNRIKTVTINCKEYKLAHYSANDDIPRPESYIEDVETCQMYQGDLMGECYRNLKAAAESGWDFSSRWIFDKNGETNANLSYTHVTRVLPVELNACLYKAFKDLSNFFLMVNNVDKQLYWLSLSDEWLEAIQAVFYDEKDGIWYDFDVVLNRNRKNFYPSNFAPLWTEAYNISLKKQYGYKAYQYVQANNITEVYMGGFPTSLEKSGQQWDDPNAWPPLQDIVIQGLYKSNDESAQDLAILFADRWLKSNMKGYNTNHTMFEKYDAITPGEYGGGGEYTVQDGFGWTNGVFLSFVNEFFTDYDKQIKCVV